MRLIILALLLAGMSSGLHAQRTLAKADQHFDVCEFSEALEGYTQALQKDEGDPDIIARIAMCYEALGENLANQSASLRD